MVDAGRRLHNSGAALTGEGEGGIEGRGERGGVEAAATVPTPRGVDDYGRRCKVGRWPQGVAKRDAATGVGGGEEGGHPVGIEANPWHAEIEAGAEVATEADRQVDDGQTKLREAQSTALRDRRMGHHLQPRRAVEEVTMVAEALPGAGPEDELLSKGRGLGRCEITPQTVAQPGNGQRRQAGVEAAEGSHARRREQVAGALEVHQTRV